MGGTVDSQAIANIGADVVIYVLSQIAEENKDRTTSEGDYCLSDQEYQLLAALCSLHEHVVVVLNVGGVTVLVFGRVPQYPFSLIEKNQKMNHSLR